MQNVTEEGTVNSSKMLPKKGRGIMLPEGLQRGSGGHGDEPKCEVGIYEGDVCSVSQGEGEESERLDSRGVLPSLPVSPEIGDTEDEWSGSRGEAGRQSAGTPGGLWEAGDGGHRRDVASE